MLRLPLRPVTLLLALGIPAGPLLAQTPNAVLPAKQDFETLQMVARLEELARSADPVINPFATREAVIAQRQKLADATRPEDIIRLRPALGELLLNNGQTEAALQEFKSFRGYTLTHGIQLSEVDDARLMLMQGISELRLAEEQNCLFNHNAESCMLPIRGGGVHTNRQGSEAAVRTFDALLAKYPQQLEAAWLLNIAHMTLGDYPAKVTKRWVLPERIFESEYPLPRFNEVAGQLGLDVDDVAGGVVMDDFDNDGRLDLMASASSMRGQLRLFRNIGDGSFMEMTSAAGLNGLVGGLNLIQADYNNDGWMDVFVLRGGWLGEGGRLPNSLLRNNGDGTFSDVTVSAGMLSFHPTQAGVWLDYNNDGWIDLFIGNEHAEGATEHPCELYSNNGDGTFTEVAAAAGVRELVFAKAVVAGDYDNDGRTDLYISARGRDNLLFRNEGPDAKGQWRFRETTKDAGVPGPAFSFPTAFFDFNNDGWLDLFVAGYGIRNVGDIARDYLGMPHAGEKARLYRNRGDGTFEDVTKDQKLDRVIHSMGFNIGDLDNDGWLDFYAGTGDPFLGTLIPSRLFRNKGGEGFQDVTTAGGFGQLQKGHGIAFGDLNEDGQQDIYSVVGGAFPGDHYHNQLFANPGPAAHWLKLKLSGKTSNRAGIGARVTVVANEAGTTRLIHRQIGSGASFGASPTRAEIGLGKADSIDRVEIYWPRSGRIQVIRGLDLDRTYEIMEDADTARLLPALPGFSWPAPGEQRLHRHLEWCAPGVEVNPEG